MVTNGTLTSWDEVKVGDELGPLLFPVTFKTLLLQAAGTRDFMPHHHHGEYCRSVGIRDAFVNTMFYQGLLGRFATDWAGPWSDIRSATLEMGDPLCLGDTARVTGRVVQKWAARGGACVELSLRVDNAEGPTATSTTVLAMPSKGTGEVAVADLGDLPVVAPRADMPAHAREALGVRTTRRGAYPVSVAQIMYWCEMVRDSNPLYTESRYARSGRYGGIVAPPTSLLIWTFGRSTQLGVDSAHPDVDLPDQEAWPEPHQVGPIEYRVPGLSHIVMQRIAAEFGVPLRPGDRVAATTELVDCTPVKRTRLGTGHFTTHLDVHRNQHGDVVGRAVLTAFQCLSPEQVTTPDVDD